MSEVHAAVSWRLVEVASPILENPVPVVAATGIPTVAGGNRLQALNLYLPATAANRAFVGTPATALPVEVVPSEVPRIHVHVHGGAWRDPRLLAASIEPAVAHAFAAPDRSIAAIASIDYALTHFPTHPTLPYDRVTAGHADPAREAVHPGHLADVLRGLATLRSLGLADDGYVLTGHSAGACLAMQAILRSPSSHGLPELPNAPCPAAIVGLNGLYDLPALTDGLGASHEHLRGIYEELLGNAYGPDRARWGEASPARSDPEAIGDRLRSGLAPQLVVLDQSAQDQLVPMNQRERLMATLAKVAGLRIVQGHRCTGVHAAPWERGDIIWNSVRDVLALLQKTSI